MRKHNLQIIALLLLLVFTQKLGLRVLLHNKFHSAVKSADSGSTASYYQVQCDCLDEALMPLAKAEPCLIPMPAEGYLETYTSYNLSLFSALKIYRSLRAPPVA